MAPVSTIQRFAEMERFWKIGRQYADRRTESKCNLPMVDHDSIGRHNEKCKIEEAKSLEKHPIHVQLFSDYTTYLEIYLHILPFNSRYLLLAYVVERWHSMNGIGIESDDLMVANRTSRLSYNICE